MRHTPINMTTIALDSSTDVCSAALLQDGKVIAERCNLTGSNHAALLPAYVQELQASLSTSASSCSNEAKPALDAIVLSEGPGSYTGLRIAASLAKGLCYGLEIPLLAVPTLAVIAHAALNAQHSTFNTQHPTLICPMIDARRMEVYCTVYDTNLRVVQSLAAKVIDEQSFADLLADHDIYFCGNGADKCKSVISHPHAHWIDGILPTSTAAGQLAHAYRNNPELVRTVAGKDIAYFEPNYLKEFVAAPSHVKGLTAH
jgi:tRNA threonylcarbamoyladenosine biosynthesis protein TsaB